MKVIKMSKKEFDKLPDYSYNNPTDLTVGKRWKRTMGMFWHLCEVFATEDPDYVDIKKKRIEVIQGENMDNAQIENNFTYHAPGKDDWLVYEQLRDKAKELAYLIKDLTPDSREQSLALTNLEQAVMWANAAVARK